MNNRKKAAGGVMPELVRTYEAGTIPLSVKALNQLSTYFREIIAQVQKGGGDE